MKRLLLTAIVLLAPLVFFPLSGVQNALALALSLSIITLWFSELIPLPVTALMVPTLAIFYGVSDVREAFQPFGNSVIFLFIGAFLLAEAMKKHGWDKRMAYLVLSNHFFSKTPERLIVTISLFCWGLSMWISNTATCAVFAPLCVGMINSLNDEFSDTDEQRKFCYRLLLTCAFSSSIGGMATPVGSPPNLLAIEFIGEFGVTIGFLEWIGIALPISLAMLAALLSILAFRYPLEEISMQEVTKKFRTDLDDLGSVSAGEIQVAACFGLAVTLWLAPGIVNTIAPQTELAHRLLARLPMGAVALFAALPLFFLPVRSSTGKGYNLIWQDAQKIDWGTIILFGGGLCLGSTLRTSGVAEQLGGAILAYSSSSFLLTGALVVAVAILISEFSSNTASASVVIPIVLAAFAGYAINLQVSLAIAAAFGASFGFMLPVSTPPNAIVYGTQLLPLRELIRSGIFFDLCGLLVITLLTPLLVPLILHSDDVAALLSALGLHQ